MITLGTPAGVPACPGTARTGQGPRRLDPAVIEAMSLSKRYAGTVAVDDLCFRVEPGQFTPQGLQVAGENWTGSSPGP